MPFDALPAEIAQTATPHRWGRPGTPKIPLHLIPLSDSDVLWNIWQILQYQPHLWRQGTVQDGASRCVVGWVVNYTEPTTVVEQWTDQGIRILRTLYDALPKSSQKPKRCMMEVLGEYNDSRTRYSVARLVRRAYEAARALDDETARC
jgi:hypothetical protein